MFFLFARIPVNKWVRIFLGCGSVWEMDMVVEFASSVTDPSGGV